MTQSMQRGCLSLAGALLIPAAAIAAANYAGEGKVFVPASRSSGGGRAWLELGPMIGHISSTNAMIWAKASGKARLSVRLGERNDLSDGWTIRGPMLWEESSFMGQVTVPKLKPATEYHYAVLLDGAPAMARPYPTFVTARPESDNGRVRFAFTSCVGDHGYNAAPGYADMASRTNFDLLLMLGDNHYANTNDPAKQRSYYADQRRQAGWRDLTARIPTYGIWDDHDYGPDNSDGTMRGKDKSLRTFREHWANPAYGEPDTPGIYSKFTRANVDFFLLDGRYYRSPNKATNLAHKTMLGERQMAWLKGGLLGSKAKVKILVSGSEWQANGTEDSWKSFRRERDEFFKFIEDNGIEGVLLISGDRHFTGAYQVSGRWIEVTSGPIGSSAIEAKNAPEIFLNFSPTKGKFYCIYDMDTSPTPPRVTLEIYRVAEGLVTRRVFTWDEVQGTTRIKTLPPPPPAKKQEAKTEGKK